MRITYLNETGLHNTINEFSSTNSISNVGHDNCSVFYYK